MERNVRDGLEFLRSDMGFRQDDPILPKPRVAPGPDQQFAVAGLDREPWANAHAVRPLFKEVFGRVSLPNFNRHYLRNTLVQLAYELPLGAEQFKAWSQKLGHDHCLTTFISGGPLPAFRQAEIVRDLAKPKLTLEHGEAAEMALKLAEFLRRPKMG